MSRIIAVPSSTSFWPMMVFPDNSLIVGAPAKVVRALDDKALELIRVSAEFYVANWRRFAGGLRRLD